MNAESAFTGPNLLVMAVFALLAVMSGVLISGRGSWMISGYNLASPAEKSKYNEKRLCRTTGVGLAVIAVAVLALGLLGEQFDRRRLRRGGRGDFGGYGCDVDSVQYLVQKAMKA